VKIGRMEIGRMEDWNDGILEDWKETHYSIIPVFQSLKTPAACP
jgi:hypothetical protein